MTALERLAKDELRLRHRSLRGVDEEQAAIGHIEDALYLSTEVGMTGSVDNIDLDSAVVDGGILREDRYTLFTLQIAGVKNQGSNFLIVAEYVALL
ncbi:MAG: hypothetical protein PVSMB7_02750 [Chloroflexota bacterium]